MLIVGFNRHIEITNLLFQIRLLFGLSFRIGKFLFCIRNLLLESVICIVESLVLCLLCINLAVVLAHFCIATRLLILFKLIDGTGFLHLIANAIALLGLLLAAGFRRRSRCIRRSVREFGGAFPPVSGGFPGP